MDISRTLQAIQEARPDEMSDIVHAISRRYKELFPDWEILFISCPKNNPKEQQLLLDYIIKYFDTHC